jgi:hypothetical protein
MFVYPGSGKVKQDKVKGFIMGAVSGGLVLSATVACASHLTGVDLLAEDQEIHALKEQIISLEPKINMLNQSSRERPFLMNVFIGFAVSLGFSILTIFALRLVSVIFHRFR